MVKRSANTTGPHKRLIAELRGHKKRIWSLGFSPDGRRLVSCCDDDVVLKIWDVEARAEMATIKAHRELTRGVATFTPDGHVIGTYALKTIRVWDAESQKVLRELECPCEITGHSITVAPIEETVCAAGARSGQGAHCGILLCWNSEGRLVGNIEAPELVNCARFSPDENWLVSTSYDRHVRIWDADSCDLRAEFEADDEWAVSAVAFLPGGDEFATAGDDHQIRFWDAHSHSLQGILRGHAAEIFGLAVSPSGSMLASACANGIVKLWDLSARKQIDTLTGHAPYVNAVAFSPVGSLLASAGADKVIRLWNVAP